jgi:hypothetical protein
LLLCDAAQVDPSGKVHLLGAGWTVVGTPLPGLAVVVLVHVAWHETVTPHVLRLRLEDADGQPVLVGPADAPRALLHEQTIVAPRPPGVPEGINIDVPVVVSFGPGMPLPPGRYVWRLEIDGASDEGWMLAFHVRAPA